MVLQHAITWPGHPQSAFRASLYRGGTGLGLSIVVGGALGIVMAWWRPVNVVLSPLLEMLYRMPKSAPIPVTALWVDLDQTA